MASIKWFVLGAGWLPALCLMGLIFYISSGPAPEFLEHKMFDLQDKALHASAFLVLALLFYRGLLWSGQPPSRAMAWIAMGLAALYGASDEWHQSFVPSRTSEMDDWIADVLGSLIVVLAYRPLADLLNWERGLWSPWTTGVIRNSPPVNNRR